MSKIIALSLLAGVIFLGGCSDEPKIAKEAKKEVKTIQWYKDHPEERKAMLKTCMDNPGELQNDPNCINAHRAMLGSSGGQVQ